MNLSLILSTLKSLSLGIWLGALIMLGYAVAGPIFRELPSKTLAGSLNGIILGRMNSLEWVCGVTALVLAVATLLLNLDTAGRTARIAEVALLVIAVGCLWYYSSPLTSRMTELRATIKDFDHPQQTQEYVAAKLEFDDLHHRYTRVVGINMILIVTTFSLSIYSAAKR